MRLQEIVASGVPSSHRQGLALVTALAVPWVLVSVVEMVSLAFYEELGDCATIERRGDLTKLCGLPRFNAMFEPHSRTWACNREGFQGLDAEGAAWVVSGASFFTAGSGPERVFASQLADAASRPVRTIAVPASGPVLTALWYLDEANQRPEERVLIFGVVGRNLKAKGFGPLTARLGPSGELRSPGVKTRATEFAKLTLRYHRKVESRIMAASRLRPQAARLSAFLPPICIDPGWNAPARLAMRNRHPMLFFREALDSVFLDFQARGGPVIVETLRRLKVHLEKRRQRLLVVIVPDKYEVFRAHVGAVLDPKTGAPERPITDVFAAELRKAGVEALSLFKALDAAQRDAPERSTYVADDTHWNDKGIRVGVGATLERLRNP